MNSSDGRFRMLSVCCECVPVQRGLRAGMQVCEQVGAFLRSWNLWWCHRLNPDKPSGFSRDSKAPREVKENVIPFCPLLSPLEGKRCVSAFYMEQISTVKTQTLVSALCLHVTTACMHAAPAPPQHHLSSHSPPLYQATTCLNTHGINQSPFVLSTRTGEHTLHSPCM